VCVALYCIITFLYLHFIFVYLILSALVANKLHILVSVRSAEQIPKFARLGEPPQWCLDVHNNG